MKQSTPPVEIAGDGNVAGDGSSAQVAKADRGGTVRNVIQISAGGDVHIGDKVYTRSQADELRDYLSQAVAAYEARIYQLVARTAVPPSRPYKFLYPFEIEDAGIFFGREVASEELYQIVLKDRLTVLHAKSGAGKTSLLNAGLSPRLIREGRLPVYARAYGDLVLAVKRALVSPSMGPWPEMLGQLTLHEFLRLACVYLGRQTQELVIILDQFEEFFIFWPEQDHRQPFIDALAECYDDRSLSVRSVIALRKDYYSDLATFQHRLPHIFHNEYHLGAMSRGEVQAAIAGPMAELDRPVAYDQNLLNTLLDDLAGSGMEPPHLQIICTRLYEALAEGETAVTLAPYEKLGRAEGILGSYLNDVLDRLPDGGELVAREVLKELVSSEATKRVLGEGTLAARIEADEGELDDVLARLVDARLLRRDRVGGETTYEIAHEYLIEKIRLWIDQADLEFKRLEELLGREVANWRVYGILIPEDRLQLLYPHREQLTGLSDEAWECILHSALEVDFEVLDWASLAGEVGIRLLLSRLDDEQEGTHAARVLGQLGDPRAVEPLIIALQDEHPSVREAVASVLGEIGDPRAVEPLIIALQDEHPSVREAVASALGEIGDPRAVGPLHITLREDQIIPVLEDAARALGMLGTAGLGPLMDALLDECWEVRRVAAEVLGELGDPRAVDSLSVALRDKSARVRRSSASALGKLGDLRAIAPLSEALQDRSSHVRSAAVEALARLGGTDVVEVLIHALQNCHADVRQKAAGILVKISDPRIVELLITALQDADPSVRSAAASALGDIGDSRAVNPLITALQDADPNVRSAAASALGGLADSRAVAPLVTALQDADPNVRSAAASALGGVGDSRAVEPLITALQDADPNVRSAAARALGDIGDSRATETLIATLKDDSRCSTGFRIASSVQEVAMAALGRLRDPRAVGPLVELLLERDYRARKAAVWALRKIGDPRAVELLIDLLRKGNNEACRVAAEALGEMGDPRAVEPLTAVLKQVPRSRDWYFVRREVVAALKRIGVPKASVALEK